MALAAGFVTLTGLVTLTLSASARAGPTQAAPSREPPATVGHASHRAAFAVGYHGQIVPWRVFLLRALPGEEVGIEVRAPAVAVGAPPGAADRAPPGTYRLRAAAGGVERTGPRSWIWTAPGGPGLHRLVIVHEPVTDGTGRNRRDGRGGRSAGGNAPPSRGDSIVLNAAVLVPLSEMHGGRVRGYRVGTYPDEVFRDLPRYRNPRGFIQVTRRNTDTRVSPRFGLGQFSVKRPRTWPKYTVLHERVLLKLELLAERAERRGVPPDGWKILSGYRSPWYNASIGRPRFSRHIFGDVADVYVDVDGDGRMDDLTGDGRVDIQDADVLYDIVDRMDEDPRLRHLLGGLGKYRATSTHGPFIHLDTRGYRARW